MYFNHCTVKNFATVILLSSSRYLVLTEFNLQNRQKLKTKSICRELERKRKHIFWYNSITFKYFFPHKVVTLYYYCDLYSYLWTYTESACHIKINLLSISKQSFNKYFVMRIWTLTDLYTFFFEKGRGGRSLFIKYKRNNVILHARRFKLVCENFVVKKEFPWILRSSSFFSRSWSQSYLHTKKK